jgi:hypothetical protein
VSSAQAVACSETRPPVLVESIGGGHAASLLACFSLTLSLLHFSLRRGKLSQIYVFVFTGSCTKFRRGKLSPIFDFAFYSYYLIFKAIVSTSGGENSRQLSIFGFSGYYLIFKAAVPRSGWVNSRQFSILRFTATI